MYDVCCRGTCTRLSSIRVRRCAAASGDANVCQVGSVASLIDYAVRTLLTRGIAKGCFKLL